MILSVHQPQYIPWLGYFDKIDKSDCFVFLDQVQYKVREYQNRNKIRTKDGSIWLTAPVVSKGCGRQKISEVRITQGSNWRIRHKRSLEAWYGRAKFFKEHFSFFEDVYSKDWERLVDLNVHIIKYLLGALRINTRLYYESEIGTLHQATDRIIQICQKLKSDVYLSGAGGKSYLEEEKFAKAKITLKFQNFIHPRYRQQYMQRDEFFLPYMSVIDLLFNEGEKSIEILRGGG